MLLRGLFSTVLAGIQCGQEVVIRCALEADSCHGGGLGDHWKGTQTITLVARPPEGIGKRKILCSTKKCLLVRKAREMLWR